MTLLSRGLLIAVLSALALSLPLPVFAQSTPVYQSGLMHPHDLAKFYTSGLVGSASLNGTEGDNSGDGVNPFLIDDHKAEALCWTTAILSATHHIACLGHDANSNAVLSLDGVDYAFPPAGNGNVLGPISSSPDNITAWNNSFGTLLKDSGIPYSAVPKGRIVMFPSASWSDDATSTTAWTVVTPPETPFICVTTSSQCFVEMLAFAETQGLSVDAFCRGQNQLGGNSGPPDNRLTTTQFPFISSAAPVSTGTLIQRYIHGNGCNITFAPEVTGAAFTINTILDGGEFIWPGQIVSTYNTPSESTFTVLIKPSACPPAEGCAAREVANTRIHIGAVASATANGATPHGAVVGVDTSLGSVGVNDIWIGEINGCGPCAGFGNAVMHDGFRVFGGSTQRGFFRNHVTIGYVHNVVQLFDLGSTDNTDITMPQALVDNDITIQHGSPGTVAGRCVIDTGQRNIWHIQSCNSDSLGPGVKYDYAVAFTATSSNARVDLNAVFGTYSHTLSTYLGPTVFPFIDLGTGNSYSLNGFEIQKWAGLQFPGVPGGPLPAGGAGGVWNYLPLQSFSSGTGATAQSIATNSLGQISVGTGLPTTVTINFSGAGFLRVPACFASSSTSFMEPTALSPNSATFTSSAAMGAGTVVNYQCSSLL